MAIEDFDFQPDTYDIVISSLTFHYLESFTDICRKINNSLTPGGAFVFSVEHPVFTAYGNQEWHYDQDGKPIHWPVDRYFTEGRRVLSSRDVMAAAITVGLCRLPISFCTIQYNDEVYILNIHFHL